MGRHHVRACADSPDIDLVAVCDSDTRIAGSVAAEFGCAATGGLHTLAENIDIAVIAVPTPAHADVALPLLETGIACLIEKPIALTLGDAQRLETAAKARGTPLRIGHIERFNPAITALRDLLAGGHTLKRVTARRLNPARDRIYDSDAVLDLMIHDLDLLWFMNLRDDTHRKPEISIQSSADFHNAAVTLVFPDGAEASLSVSRETVSPRRDLVIETNSHTYSVDFTSRRVTEPSGDGQRDISVTTADALRAQLAAFVSAVRGDTSDVADATAATHALTLAQAIRDAAGVST